MPWIDPLQISCQLFCLTTLHGELSIVTFLLATFQNQKRAYDTFTAFTGFHGGFVVFGIST
jgi:hypothetical protein